MVLCGRRRSKGAEPRKAVGGWRAKKRGWVTMQLGDSVAIIEGKCVLS